MKKTPAVLGPFGPRRPEFQYFTLENGLQVVLCPDYFKPSVSVCVTYHAGSAMEKSGKTGIAHLIEHLFCNNTAHLPYPEMDIALLEMGARMLAYTTRDLVWTETSAPRDTLEKLLRIDSDRMGHFIHTLTQEDIDKERKVIIQEIRNAEKNLVNNPWYLIQPLLYEKPHPYNHGTFGVFNDIFNWQLEDVRDYFQRYFIPNNAAISVTGDFDPENARQLVEKYFGEISPGLTPAKPEQSPVKLSEVKSIVWPAHNCNKALLAVYFPMPAFSDTERMVMDITNWYFLWHREKSLNSILKNRDLIYSVGFGLDNFERSSYLKLIFRLKPGVNMNDVLAVWDDYINSFPQEEIDISGFADTINAYLDFHQPDLQHIAQLSAQMCHDTILRGRPDAIFDDFEAVNELSREDIMLMFHKIYDKKTYLTFGTLPPDQLNAAIENAEIFHPEIINTTAEKVQPAKKQPVPPLPTPVTSFNRSIDPPYLPNTPDIEHPEVWTKVFDNGMKMMGIKSGIEHKISIRIILKGGILFEPPGKTGLTYLMNTVWKKSRTSDGKLKFISEFLKLNAELKIHSYNSYTQIDIPCEWKHFEFVISLLEELILNPKYDQQTFDEEKESILRMIDKLKTWQYIQSEILATRVLCGFNSPHAIAFNNTNGDQTECVRAITSDDIANHFNYFIRPQLAHILIYGNIKPEECIKQFTSLSDKWKAEPITVPPAIIIPEKPDTYEKRVSGSTQSYLKLVLPIAKEGYEHLAELNVVFHPLIMTGFGNLITNELRMKHALTYNNYNFISPLYDSYYFKSEFYVDYKNEEASMKLIDDLLVAYPDTYTEELFEKSRQRILRERLIHFNKPEKYLTLLTEIALHDYPPDHFAREDDIIRYMTYEQAKEIVKNNFGERRHSWIIV